jgi:hypothetical protein
MTRYCKQLLVVLARLHPLCLSLLHRVPNIVTVAQTQRQQSRHCHARAASSTEALPATPPHPYSHNTLHEHTSIRVANTHSCKMAADMDIDFTRRNKKPRPLSEHEKEKLDEFVDAIHYSAR